VTLRIGASTLAAALVLACGGSGGTPTPPDACALSTSGAAWIAFTSTQSGNKDLWLVRADGTCRTQITTDAAEDSSPAWAGPDALGFFSQRSTGTGIYQHAFPAGTEARVPLAIATAVTSPAWSVDLTQLAIEGRRSGITHSEIFLAPGGGGPANSLTTHADASNDAGPVWSPDGSKIYFVSNRGGSVTQVYVMGADGSSPTAVTTDTSSVLGRPALSPDGKKLAFVRSNGASQGPHAVVWVRDLDTHSETNVSGENTDSDPAFDPTGTHLAVSRVQGANPPALWIMDLDGSHAARVTTPAAGVIDNQPAFRPE
jgi:TolB protein